MASTKQQENMLLTEHFSWPPIVRISCIDIRDGVQWWDEAKHSTPGLHHRIPSDTQDTIANRSSQSLIDDIINATNEVLYRCTDSFETGLSSADPSLLGFHDRYLTEKRMPDADENGEPQYPEARLEIEEGVLKLETLMENAVDKNFDKLEIWVLRNVFALSRGDEELVNWIRLNHYEVSYAAFPWDGTAHVVYG
jgi:kinetochore protein Mis12/MTW1